MKKAIVVFWIFLGTSCALDTVDIHEVSNGEVTVRWFFDIHFNNNSPETIELKKGFSREIVYEASTKITDIRIEGKTIIIQVWDDGGYVHSKTSKETFFGYKIEFDETGTFQQIQNVSARAKESK